MQRHLAVILVLGVSGLAFGAGLATHQEICERAIAMIEDPLYGELCAVLSARQNAADSGCVHPDGYYGLSYLYPKRREHFEQAASLAHDYGGRQFRDAAAAYLRESLPEEWTDGDELLVAFFLGNLVHQEADRAWHPGFNAECRDRDHVNEALIEPGCDLFCMREQGERNDWIRWYVPSEAVSDVFAACGLEVLPEDVVTGMAGVRVAVFLEHVAGQGLYRAFVKRLPWGHENYVTYPDGGVVDCAFRSARGCEAFWDQLFPDADASAEALDQPAPTDLNAGNRVFLRLATELQLMRAVDVPRTALPDGGVLLGRPLVRDRAALEWALRRRLWDLLREESPRPR